MIPLRIIDDLGKRLGADFYAEVPRKGDLIEIPLPPAEQGGPHFRTVHKIKWYVANELKPDKFSGRHHIPSPHPIMAADVTVILAPPSAADEGQPV